MVLTLGFEPSLDDPQSPVLTNNTKSGWCPRRDLNPQHSASKADASANWTTRALYWSGLRDSNSFLQLGRLGHNPYTKPALMEFREGLKPSTSAFVARCSIQLSYRNWSGQSGSNRRHLRWQRSALPLSYTRLRLEVPPRVELGSQGFADPRITVLLRHHWLGIKDSNLE